jgi:hypothetical protein
MAFVRRSGELLFLVTDFIKNAITAVTEIAQGRGTRDTTGDYMLDRFRAGEDALHTIEAAELGDICCATDGMRNARRSG